MSTTSITKNIVNISAKVYRVNWDNKPSFINKSIWLFLKKFKFPGTYTVEKIELVNNQ